MGTPITIRGVEYADIEAAAKAHGLTLSCVRARISRGTPIADAFSPNKKINAARNKAIVAEIKQGYRFQGTRLVAESLPYYKAVKGTKQQQRFILLRCDCSPDVVIERRLSHILDGKSASCGCGNREALHAVLTIRISKGEESGRWRALEDGRSVRDKRGVSKYCVKAQCVKCGTIRDMPGTNFRHEGHRCRKCLSQRRKEKRATLAVEAKAMLTKYRNGLLPLPASPAGGQSIVGVRHHFFLILTDPRPVGKDHHHVICRCDCGKFVDLPYNPGSGLGKRQSCGCKRRATVSRKAAERDQTKHMLKIRWKYTGKSHEQPILMRSSWELAVAHRLDSLGVQWEYEPKMFSLESDKAYVPDFYVAQWDAWIEVKGWMRKSGLEKIEEFRRTGRRLIVFGKDTCRQFTGIREPSHAYASCARRAKGVRSRQYSPSSRLTERDASIILWFLGKHPPTSSRSSLSFGAVAFLARWFAVCDRTIIDLNKGRTFPTLDRKARNRPAPEAR